MEDIEGDQEQEEKKQSEPIKIQVELHEIEQNKKYVVSVAAKDRS